jgi:ABC-type glycerol-3-phosphate transport system substrate-binding protein
MKTNIWLIIIIVLNILLIGCKSDSSKRIQTDLEFLEHKPEAIDTFRMLSTQFTQENPHITVTPKYLPDMAEVLKQKATVNNLPHLMSLLPFDSVFRKFIAEGQISKIENIGEEKWPDLAREMVSEDGDIYGLPLSMNVYGMYVNTDLDSPPMVFDDFDHFMEYVKTVELPDNTYPIVISPESSWSLGHLALILLEQNIGFNNTYWEELQSGKRDANMEDYWEETLDQIIAIKRIVPREMDSWDYSKALEVYSEGYGLFLPQGSWVLNTLPDSWRGRLQPLPGKRENRAVCFGIDIVITMRSNMEKHERDASLAFIKYLSEDRQNKLYLKQDKALPISLNSEVEKEFGPVWKQLQQQRAFVWPTSRHENLTSSDLGKNIQEFYADEDKQKFLSYLKTTFNRK